MKIRRMFDRLQFMLHLKGMHRLASYLGRWGTPETYPTLRAIDFDPTFQRMHGIEAKDIAFPIHKHDVN